MKITHHVEILNGCMVVSCNRLKLSFCFVLVEIRNGNLKSILGLFFILSRYKQQQQQQQQYYQSLVELSQQTSSTTTSPSKTQDMQSRYVTQMQKLHTVVL